MIRLKLYSKIKVDTDSQFDKVRSYGDASKYIPGNRIIRDQKKQRKRKKEEASYQSQALLLFKIAVQTSAPLAVCTTALFSAVHLKLQSHPPAQVGKSFCRASEIKKSKDTCQLDHLLCWFANPEDFFQHRANLIVFLTEHHLWPFHLYCFNNQSDPKRTGGHLAHFVTMNCVIVLTVSTLFSCYLLIKVCQE